MKNKKIRGRKVFKENKGADLYRLLAYICAPLGMYIRKRIRIGAILTASLIADSCTESLGEAVDENEK